MSRIGARWLCHPILNRQLCWALFVLLFVLFALAMKRGQWKRKIELRMLCSNLFYWLTKSSSSWNDAIQAPLPMKRDSLRCRINVCCLRYQFTQSKRWSYLLIVRKMISRGHFKTLFQSKSALKSWRLANAGWFLNALYLKWASRLYPIYWYGYVPLVGFGIIGWFVVKLV